MLETGKLVKGDRVMYRLKRATVEKPVGGHDYIIVMDTGGKRFCVDGRRLTHFEEVLPEEAVDAPSVSSPEVAPEPDNAVEGTDVESVGASGEDAPSADEEEEADEGAEQEGSGKPMLARKKFEAMNKTELYRLAQLYEVPGRSGMDIDGLRSALALVIDLQ